MASGISENLNGSLSLNHDDLQALLSLRQGESQPLNIPRWFIIVLMQII